MAYRQRLSNTNPEVAKTNPQSDTMLVVVFYSIEAVKIGTRHACDSR